MEETTNLPFENRVELARRLDVAKGVAEVIRKHTNDIIKLDRYPKHITMYARLSLIYMLAGLLAAIASFIYHLEFIGVALVLFVMAIEGYQHRRGLRLTKAILSMEINMLLKDWVGAGHSLNSFEQLKKLIKDDENDFGSSQEWSALWDELEKNAIRRISQI
jgi:hypothetical protein